MRPRRLALILGALGVTAAVVGCGSKSISVSKQDPTHTGAVIFAERCSGCHTLDVVGAQGSATSVRSRERVDGPNFNVRHEQVDQVLYAIRNGGFSGAIMPENIVVGRDADAVAKFLAKYSGRKAKAPPSPGQSSTQ